MNEDSLEVKTAIQAVVEASKLCRKVQEDLIGEVSFVKSDRSPVTVADYGAQAIICKYLKEAFPGDSIIAEEDSTELRNSPVLRQVTDYVKERIPDASPGKVSDWIDFSSRRLADRFWALDPVDGTKGFLRGDQYAIALALIENGEVRIGIMACPNLHMNVDQPRGPKGCIFVASSGMGSVQMTLEGRDRKTLSVSKSEDLSRAFYTESVESDHSDHLFHKQIARKLSISNPAIRIDSQAKYGIVARGEAVFYLRIPIEPEIDYKESIWDHAAGVIIAEEAGGGVTDAFGRRLDLFSGIKMVNNYGVVVTNGVLHERVLRALHPLPVEERIKR